MGRRVWTGIAAGVLAATVVVGIAGTAYRIGQRDEVVTRTVGEGEVVGVVGGHGWGHGPGPGFLLFPLAVVAVVLLVRGRRGPGWGGGLPPYGPPEQFLREWHLRAHDEEQRTTPTATGSPPGAPER
jgi:hypothetical protein